MSFAQVIAGQMAALELSTMVRCKECKGQKVKPTKEQETCPKCYGTGENVDIVGDVCHQCYGSGLRSISCTSCKGDGIEVVKKIIGVNIPRSVDTGMLLRVKGKGNEGLNGVPGDLILHVDVKKDPDYTRNGFDIMSEKTISISEAVFGGTVDVETIHGKRQMSIPAGTEHNTQIKIKHSGLTHLKSEEKGDHIVTVKIQIPKTLNKQQKQALESYAKIE